MALSDATSLSDALAAQGLTLPPSGMTQPTITPTQPNPLPFSIQDSQQPSAPRSIPSDLVQARNSEGGGIPADLVAARNAEQRAAATTPANPERAPLNASSGQGEASPQLTFAQGAGKAAGYVPGTHDLKESGKTSPFQDALNEGIAQGSQAQQQLGEAQLGLESAQGPVQGRAATITGAFDRLSQIQSEMRARHARAELDEKFAHVQALEKDAADMKIDPHKWWKDKSTANKIFSALGMALAGFGYGYSGRGINPQQYIESEMQSSVEAQREEMANKRAAVGEARNVYRDLADKFGSDEAATKALEVGQRTQLVTTLQQQANDATAPAAVRLRAAQFAADQAAKRQQALEHLHELNIQNVERSTNEKYREAQPGGASAMIRLPGGQSVNLQQYKQLQDMGLVPAQGLEARKASAEARKTEAEAAKLEGEQGGGSQAQIANRLGAGLQSTRAFENPGLAASRLAGKLGFETQGQSADEAREAYNTMVMSTLGTKLQIRDPEKREQQLRSVLIQPGDSTEKIAEKRQLYGKLQGLPDAAPEGFTEDR